MGHRGLQVPGGSDDGVRAPPMKRAWIARISALGHKQADSQQMGTGHPMPPGAAARRAPRGPEEWGAAAGVSAGRVHTCCPGTSRGSVPTAPGYPEPAFAMSSNLKHSPGNLKGSTPVQEPRQGLHVAAGCQAAVSGAAGLAGGCQLCLLFPFLPWILRRPSRHGGARILGKAQRPYSGAGESRTRGPCARCTPGPHSNVRLVLRLPPNTGAGCPWSPCC